DAFSMATSRHYVRLVKLRPDFGGHDSVANLWIELTAAKLKYLGPCLFHRESLSIRSICGHRVERVCEHDNARRLWYRCSLPPVRVPRPVPVLMMVANGRHDVFKARQQPDQFSTSNGVTLHEFPFFGRQP